jgi:hypothetical protein
MVDRFAKLLIVGWVIGLCVLFRFWYKEEERKDRQHRYRNSLAMIDEWSHQCRSVERTTLEEMLKRLHHYPQQQQFLLRRQEEGHHAS